MILIAIGANLPTVSGTAALGTCRWAVLQLARLPGLRLVGLSCWYRTTPVPRSDQPDYVNGAAHLEGMISPEAMLDHLQTIEQAAGRVRSIPNAARVLDLDLLAIDSIIIQSARLALPHSRLQDRTFVLAPLCDVAPGWMHPVLGRTVREMLSALPEGRPHLL